MTQKKRRSKQEKARDKAEAIFVGREEPIQQFRRHLESGPDDDDFVPAASLVEATVYTQIFLSKRRFSKTKICLLFFRCVPKAPEGRPVYSPGCKPRVKDVIFLKAL